MKRVCLCAAVTLTTMMMAACSNNSDNPGSPTSPSNPSTAVRAVQVSGAPATTTTYQMHAKADLSDGTSRDVTTQSQWSTSNADIATIEASGVLTIRRSGQVEVRAAYQNMAGTMTLTVSAPQPPPPPPSGEFILSGTVHDSTLTGAGLGGVLVRIVSGPNTGTSITTSADGRFGFLKVKGGEAVVEAQKDGYQTARTTVTLDRDREIDIVLMPMTTP